WVHRKGKQLRLNYEKEIHFKIRLLQHSHFNCFRSLPLRRLCGAGRFWRVRPDEGYQGFATTCSLQYEGGCSWYTDSGCHTNGRSRPLGPGFAKPALRCAKEGIRGATFNAISPFGQWAGKRPIRILALRPEVCASIAQKSVAPDPEHARAIVYIRRARR